MGLLRELASTSAFRWSLAVAGAFAVMALSLFAFIYWQTAVAERDRIDALVVNAARFIGDAPPGEVPLRIEQWLAEDLHSVRFAGLFGPDGARLAGNLQAGPHALPKDGTAYRAILNPISRDADHDDPEIVRGVARRLSGPTLLVVGYDIDQLEQVQAIVERGLALGVLPAVLLSVLSGTFFAIRAQRRVGAIHSAIEQIMKGDLHGRLPVRRRADELDKVAAAVNGMLAQLERLVHDLHGVGDSMAHDLRTPLTRVRTGLERARDHARTPAEFQAVTDRAIVGVDHALSIIRAILRIGEIEHGRRQAAFGPVDLAEVLLDVAELYEPLAEERQVKLTTYIGPARPIKGDRDLLLEAVGNLVDNAIKYAPSGTEVLLSLSTTPDTTYCRISNRGPGIPPLERDRVVQRFYRSERSRTVEGNGLGLSLVFAITILHGFDLQIGDAEPGCGPGCAIEIVCPQ